MVRDPKLGTIFQKLRAVPERILSSCHSLRGSTGRAEMPEKVIVIIWLGKRGSLSEAL